MEDYKIRLIQEHDELMLRIQKLRDYLYGLDTELYRGQFRLLGKQYIAMEEYCMMLEWRAEKEGIDLDAVTG